MMSRERELLEQLLDVWNKPYWLTKSLYIMEKIRTYLAETEGDVLGVSDKDRNRLFYGFLLDCNSIGPESAGVNLARGIKTLLQNHKIREDDK